MIDLERLSQLYTTAHDETQTPAQRQKAAKLLTEIDADNVVAEYLSLSESSGDDERDAATFSTAYDKFAGSVLLWLVRKPGESNEEMHTREDRLRADKLGILVRHLLREKAKALRKTDFDYVVLFGDDFHLALWPPHGPFCYGLPEPTPTEVILT
jgi:hypothetical protein